MNQKLVLVVFCFFIYKCVNYSSSCSLKGCENRNYGIVLNGKYSGVSVDTLESVLKEVNIIERAKFEKKSTLSSGSDCEGCVSGFKNSKLYFDKRIIIEMDTINADTDLFSVSSKIIPRGITGINVLKGMLLPSGLVNVRYSTQVNGVDIEFSQKLFVPNSLE